MLGVPWNSSLVRLCAAVALSAVIVLPRLNRVRSIMLTQFLMIMRCPSPSIVRCVLHRLQSLWFPRNSGALGEPRHPGLLLPLTIWLLKVTACLCWL